MGGVVISENQRPCTQDGRKLKVAGPLKPVERSAGERQGYVERHRTTSRQRASGRTSFVDDVYSANLSRQETIDQFARAAIEEGLFWRDVHAKRGD